MDSDGETERRVGSWRLERNSRRRVADQAGFRVGHQHVAFLKKCKHSSSMKNRGATPVAWHSESSVNGRTRIQRNLSNAGEMPPMSSTDKRGPRSRPVLVPPRPRAIAAAGPRCFPFPSRPRTYSRTHRNLAEIMQR